MTKGLWGRTLAQVFAGVIGLVVLFGVLGGPIA